MDSVAFTLVPKDGFSWYLLERHRALFEANLAHPLIVGLSTGDLPDVALRRYVHYEHAFVETAVALNGYLLAKAPSLDARRRIAAAAVALVTTQEAWFTGAYETLDEPRVLGTSRLDLPVGVTAMQDFTLRIASMGTFEEALATVLAAEVLYGTWCTLASGSTPHAEPVASWIAMHAASDFVEHVRWVARWIDAYVVDGGPAARESMEEIFVRMLQLELGFHGAAFETPSSS